jgi:hypothetical protein
MKTDRLVAIQLAASTDEKRNQANVFFTEAQLAERQQKSVKTLRNDRLTGRGIPFIKIGRLVRYRLSDVLAFEEANLRRSTSDRGG